MRKAFIRGLGRLSVGRKLALIYLLDLTAIVVVSAFLVHEQLLAIDFARAEIGGVAQIVPLQREVLQGQARHALEAGRERIHAIGNASKLILDPDLDSYYTMSLVVLRYPSLLTAAHDVGTLVSLTPEPGALRLHYLALDGQLETVSRDIVADHEQAFDAASPALRQALAPDARSIAERVQVLRFVARSFCDGRADASMVRSAHAELLAAVGPAWGNATQQLDRLLHERVSRLQQRMALHLGIAAAVLLAALALVVAVARQIALPLQRLAAVAERVRASGDHSLRVNWRSQDEIGHLVETFHEMLAQLDHERELQKEHAAAARAAQAEQALVEATPTSLVVTTVGSHQVLHANPQAQTWLAGTQVDPWQHALDPAVRERFFRQLDETGIVEEFEAQWRAGDASSWAMLSARRMQFQGHDAVITTFAPINQLKLLELRLALWGRVFEASGESIVIVDAERRIQVANPAFHAATGFSADAVAAQSPALLLGRDEPADRLDALWRGVAERGAWQGELRLARADGSDYPAWLLASPVRGADDAITHTILTSLDISDRKRSEERIRFLAEHDVLTQLPNRSLCVERLRRALERARASGHKVAVMFIDLDKFKEINDTLGHHVGDGLLRSVAQRLGDSVRAADTVSRLGGDEFVVVVDGAEDVGEIRRMVERRLIPLVRSPHFVEGHELRISCSVGIAVFPDHADELDELMRLADIAMYRAKGGGRDAACFYAGEPAVAI